MKIKEDLKYLVESIKKYREQKGKTKTEVAKNAFNTTPSIISKFENDKVDFKKLTYENLYLISSALDRSPDEFFKQVQRHKNNGYVLIEGGKINTNTKNAPSHIIRVGKVIEKNEVTYCSLLDAVNNEQEIITDFQMIISEWEPNSESMPHYQWGEELFIPLDGSLEYQFMDENSRGYATADKWTVNYNLSHKLDEYIWLKGWFPHKGVTGKEGTTALIISSDQRGERGLFRNEKDEDNIKSTKTDVTAIEDDDKLFCQPLLRGLGVRLKAARLRSGQTAKEISDLAGLKSSAELYKIETNLVNPKIEIILKLSEILDVNYLEFFPHKSPPVKYGKLNTDLKKKNNNQYGTLKCFDLLPKNELNHHQSTLNVLMVIPDNNSKAKFDLKQFDLAFFVLEGTFEFIFKFENEKHEEEKVTHNLIKWDTIYVQAKNEHRFRALDSSAKGLMVYIKKNGTTK